MLAASWSWGTGSYGDAGVGDTRAGSGGVCSHTTQDQAPLCLTTPGSAWLRQPLPKDEGRAGGTRRAVFSVTSSHPSYLCPFSHSPASPGSKNQLQRSRALGGSLHPPQASPRPCAAALRLSPSRVPQNQVGSSSTASRRGWTACMLQLQ